MTSCLLALSKMGPALVSSIKRICSKARKFFISFVVVVVLLFYVHGKHLRSCWDGQLT